MYKAPVELANAKLRKKKNAYYMGEMAQWGRGLNVEPDDQSSIPETNIMEDQQPTSQSYTCTPTLDTPPHTHTHTLHNKDQFFFSKKKKKYPMY